MNELECITCDGYDREIYGEVLRTFSSVRNVEDQLRRLIPEGPRLLQDLFLALYKLNVVLRPVAELSGMVLLHRRLLRAVLESTSLHALRKRTELQHQECARALPVLAESIIAALEQEYAFNAPNLDKLDQLARDEKEMDRLEREKAHLENLPPGTLPDEAALKISLDIELRSLAKQIDKAKKAQEALAERLTTDVEDAIDQKMRSLPNQLAQGSELVDQMGLGQGGEGRVGAEKRLELGDRLLRSKKLRLLARLVGAFRDVALEARRKRIVRAPQELHEIHLGAELERLLPSELIGLSKERKLLHRDFMRRFFERQLLEYRLEASAERGPMVVCLDGSSSMSGSKELWSKAVALTLMEIARREKRRCLGLIFSDGPSLFEVELLNKGRRRQRAQLRDEEILRFAEHFPGGGTSFEEPLARALTVVTGESSAHRAYRRGDIIFITDGEAQVSASLLERVAEKRRKFRFSIRGILVDSPGSQGDILASFCDDVRCVSDLTGDSVRDLFSAV